MYISNEAFLGAPDNIEERTQKEQEVYSLLKQLNIEFYRADHDCADTIEACKDIEKVLGTQICKNLFLCNRQMTDFYLLLIAPDKNFRTSVVSKLLGVSRLSFGNAEYMQSLLGLTPGSVSIFGLMNDKDKKVRLLIDSSILDSRYFGAHPSINTSTLRIEVKDLLDKIIPALNHEPTILSIPTIEVEEL